MSGQGRNESQCIGVQAQERHVDRALDGHEGSSVGIGTVHPQCQREARDVSGERAAALCVG